MQFFSFYFFAPLSCRESLFVPTRLHGGHVCRQEGVFRVAKNMLAKGRGMPRLKKRTLTTTTMMMMNDDYDRMKVPCVFSAVYVALFLGESTTFVGTCVFLAVPCGNARTVSNTTQASRFQNTRCPALSNTLS